MMPTCVDGSASDRNDHGRNCQTDGTREDPRQRAKPGGTIRIGAGQARPGIGPSRQADGRQDRRGTPGAGVRQGRAVRAGRDAQVHRRQAAGSWPRCRASGQGGDGAGRRAGVPARGLGRPGVEASGRPVLDRGAETEVRRHRTGRRGTGPVPSWWSPGARNAIRATRCHRASRSTSRNRWTERLRPRSKACRSSSALRGDRTSTPQRRTGSRTGRRSSSSASGAILSITRRMAARDGTSSRR